MSHWTTKEIPILTPGLLLRSPGQSGLRCNSTYWQLLKGWKVHWKSPWQGSHWGKRNDNQNASNNGPGPIRQSSNQNNNLARSNQNQVRGSFQFVGPQPYKWGPSFEVTEKTITGQLAYLLKLPPKGVDLADLYIYPVGTRCSNLRTWCAGKSGSLRVPWGSTRGKKFF